LRYWDDTPVNLPAKAPRAKPKPDAPTEPFAVTVHRGDALLLEGVYEVRCLANRRSMVVPNAVQIMASLVAVSAS
jgi:hypothetical protein